MPIYRYRCEGCDALSEKITVRSDDKSVECVDCGGSLKKLPSVCRTYMAAHGDIKGAPRRPGFDNVRGRRHPVNVRQDKPGLV